MVHQQFVQQTMPLFQLHHIGPKVHLFLTNPTAKQTNFLVRIVTSNAELFDQIMATILQSQVHRFRVDQTLFEVEQLALVATLARVVVHGERPDLPELADTEQVEVGWL
jgi:hypothetical protein